MNFKQTVLSVWLCRGRGWKCWHLTFYKRDVIGRKIIKPVVAISGTSKKLLSDSVRGSDALLPMGQRDGAQSVWLKAQVWQHNPLEILSRSGKGSIWASIGEADVALDNITGLPNDKNTGCFVPFLDYNKHTNSKIPTTCREPVLMDTSGGLRAETRDVKMSGMVLKTWLRLGK